MSDRKKMFRFSMQHDLDLLTEVVSLNPFAGDSCNKWSTIAENFMEVHKESAVDGRRCRERTSLLLSYYKAEDRERLYKSGTDEEYADKEKLLQEVISLSESVVKHNKKLDTNKTVAATIRKRALENLKSENQDDDTSGPGKLKQKRSTTNMIDYLKSKHSDENEIEIKKIELESKKLELEERKQSLEQERFRMDREERQSMIELMKSVINSK